MPLLISTYWNSSISDNSEKPDIAVTAPKIMINIPIGPMILPLMCIFYHSLLPIQVSVVGPTMVVLGTMIREILVCQLLANLSFLHQHLILLVGL